MEALGNAPGGVFSCTVEAYSTAPATKKRGARLFSNLLLFARLTDRYPPMDPIHTMVPVLRGRM